MIVTSYIATIPAISGRGIPYTLWGIYLGYIMEKKMETTIMENQMEKKMENEMETGMI